MFKKEQLSLVDVLSELDNMQQLAQISNYQYYNNLFNKRTVILNGPIDDTLIETVFMPLYSFEQDDSDEPVTLFINTCGGDVLSGLKLLPLIDNYKKKLNIYCLDAFSMGAIIMCAGFNNPNVKKYCYAYSYVLFHDGYNALEGEAKTVEDLISFNKTLDKKIKEYVLKNTKISRDFYEKHERKQLFLDAQEMKDYGIVDEIIGDYIKLGDE